MKGFRVAVFNSGELKSQGEAFLVYFCVPRLYKLI